MFWNGILKSKTFHTSNFEKKVPHETTSMVVLSRRISRGTCSIF